jgi:phosphoglycolate phosphatase
MAAQPGVRAALLDFDGTLVDLPVDWDDLRARISAVLHPHGIRGALRPLYPAISDAFDVLQSRGVPGPVRASVRRRINNLMTQVELEALERAEVLPGSRELLERLHTAGWKIIIQTSNSVRVVEEACRRFSLAPVDVVVGRETARLGKPHPQGVRQILRTLGIREAECVVVGDGDYDVQLGRAIGARTIRVNSRHASESPLPADHHVGSLAEVADLLLGERQLVEASA